MCGFISWCVVCVCVYFVWCVCGVYHFVCDVCVCVSLYVFGFIYLCVCDVWLPPSLWFGGCGAP